MNENKIGKFITELRKEKNMTQKELAEKLYVTDKAVSKWERGLSLPDISLLEKLSEELEVDVSELLRGKRGKKEKINVEEEIKKAVEEIKSKQKSQKRKQLKIIAAIGLGIILILGILIFLYKDYKKYHPDRIVEGENNYKIDYYRLQTKGLEELENIIKKTDNISPYYNISRVKIKVSKTGKLENFDLDVIFFDNKRTYIGDGYYRFKDSILTYNYFDKQKLLVENYSKNDTIDFINEQLLKIPLEKQIKESSLKEYYVTYQSGETLEKGTKIIDARNNKKIKVLSQKQLKNKVGGEIEKTDAYFAIKLNNGSEELSGPQYIYVFDPMEEVKPKNVSNIMQTDYYIGPDKLQFTRDYGASWIDADITKEQIDETLNFYRDKSLNSNSWFISTDEDLPIAYFYGEEPTLVISNDNGKTWTEHKLITSEDTFNKPITQRVVGFTSKEFGYVALGTDWTMGSGEIKKIFFTYDGGKTWKEKKAPEEGTSHILYDLCMYDDQVGVLVLRDRVDSAFPIVYTTQSGGEGWTKVKYADNNIPDEVTYLTEVDSIDLNGNTSTYYIKMGQGNGGTLKATFRTGDLTSMSLKEISYEPVHIVG